MNPSLTQSSHVSRRSLVLGAVFTATAGAAAATTPRRHEAILSGVPLKTVIADRVASWTRAQYSNAILPDAEPTDVYDQIVSRAYTSPNWPPIMLVVAYGAAQSGLMKVHRPEVCYTSAGFKIVKPQVVAIPLQDGRIIPANTFLGERQDRNEHVLYWTRISNAFPGNLIDQRIVMFEQGLSGVIPDGVLVRLSTLCPDWALAQSALTAFASGLVTNSSPLGRALLIGRPRSRETARTA
jgi:EpsI family protein